MSKLYSKQMLDTLAKNEFEVIVEFNQKCDGEVDLGIFKHSDIRSGYMLRPLNINEGGVHFSRGHIKRIVYLSNGLVYPKEENGQHKILDILELNELVNKAGYEFF